MRKLVWFVIGFAVACYVGSWFFESQLLLLGGLVFTIASVPCMLLRSKAGKITALCLLGLGIGFLLVYGYAVAYYAPVAKVDGKTQQLEIEVCAYTQERESGQAAEGYVSMEGMRYRIWFYYDEARPLEPGDVVRGTFYVKSCLNNRSMAGGGYFLVGYSEDSLQFFPAKETKPIYFAQVFRQRMIGLVTELFPPESSGFAAALLIGDTDGLSDEDTLALRDGGIWHVVSVSGLHVSILFGVLYTLCGKRRGWTALFGFPLLLIFAAITGFAPSAVRACLMQGLMILAMLCNREYDPPTALAFSVLVLLAANPMGIASVSLQLSVASTGGILLFSDRISQWFFHEKRFGPCKGKHWKMVLGRWFARSVATMLGAMALTVPLCAYHFGVVSLIGIVTNLLTLGAITYIFYGCILVSLVGMVYAPMGSFLGAVTALGIQGVLEISRFLAGLPLATAHMDSIYMVLWLVFSYGLIVAFLCGKRKYPGIVIGGIALSLLLSLSAAVIESRQDQFRLSVLDVGQGQCILLQSADACYVIDCGGGSGQAAAETAAGTLMAQGIYKIDGLILSHFDQDHVGGAGFLLMQMPAEKLYMPKVKEERTTGEQLADIGGSEVYWVYERLELPCGNGTLTIFPGEAGSIGNESSLCILFQTESCDILITGDRNTAGETKLIQQEKLPDLEVLVVGHHGADSSTGWALLAETRPNVAVISVGKDNYYGHPDPDTLERLELFGCRILRTDELGSIIIRG